MSLRPQDPPTVPEETCRVARAAFPKGTLCLRIADALGAVYQDRQRPYLLDPVCEVTVRPTAYGLDGRRGGP